MGILVLLAIGAVLGWLASILARDDSGKGALINVAVGAVGAVISAAIATRDPLLFGVSVIALLWGCAGTCVLLGAYHLARRRLVG